MRSVNRVLGFVVLAVVGLLASGYALFGVVGTIEVAVAKHQARSDVEGALPLSQRRAELDRDSARAALASKDPALTSPTYSFTELDCHIESNDAGWMVQDYYQECDVRTVDLYAVADGPAECDDEYDAVGTPAEAAGHVVVHTARAEALDSDEPWRHMCPDGVVAPSRSGASRVLAGARPADLDASPGWVMVETTTPVSETTLGCNPWAIIFCTEPVTGPALPD